MMSSSGQDHLHTRGEYQAIKNTDEWEAGSPPHTWRIPALITPKHSGQGITSTHVENTRKVVAKQTDRQDHLHTRGEY